MDKFWEKFEIWKKLVKKNGQDPSVEENIEKEETPAAEKPAKAEKPMKEKKPRKPLRMGTGWVKAAGGVLSVPWMLVKIALGLVGTVLLVFLTTGVIFACSMANYLQEDVLPKANYEFDFGQTEKSSFIYATDPETGEITVLQQIYAEIDRQWVPYDEIPEDLVNAAIAIEDKRFREHAGVDWFRTGKACIQMFLGGSSEFGGSTITQQFIKNDTGEDDVTVRRKVQEIFRALQYEKNHSKEEIMENYLNTIYLGENCAGVKSASLVYFGKDVSELTAAECASLIGITNNPSLFDPYISMERNRERQLIILEQMHEQGYLTDIEYSQAITQKMVFRNRSGDQTIYTCPNCGQEGVDDDFEYDYDTGLDICFNCGTEFLIESPSEGGYSYFVDAVFSDVVEALQAKTGYSAETCREMIKKGGYHIYSTIDLKAQEKVDAVYEDLSNVPKTRSAQQLQSAIVVVDNATGDIVALAGGVGKKTGYLEWSRATRSTLQTGSSMKPISVYAPALEAGAICPATIITDGPLYDNYPQNYSRSYSGKTNVLYGVTQSLNAVSAQVVNMVGAQWCFDFAKYRFGLSTLVEEGTYYGETKSDIGIAPMALGALTEGARVSDMACAYATFPNNGVWREGRTFTIVYDSEGNVVLDNTQESRKILSDRTATYMNYMLSQAVYGTGWEAQISGMNVAGKTGTTSDDRDRWFCGYTPYYTAAVWCGYDMPEQIYVNGNPAAQMWKKVMSSLVAGKPNQSLYSTSGMSTVTMCRDSGKYYTDACKKDVRGDRTLSALVFSGDAPSVGKCDMHVMVDYCEKGKAIANEYCKQIKDNKVVEKSMCKYTEKDIKWYKESCKITIPKEAIYDEKNVCKVHTKEMLEEQNKPTEPETEPTEATEPTDPPAEG